MRDKLERREHCLFNTGHVYSRDFVSKCFFMFFLWFEGNGNQRKEGHLHNGKFAFHTAHLLPEGSAINRGNK